MAEADKLTSPLIGPDLPGDGVISFDSSPMDFLPQEGITNQNPVIMDPVQPNSVVMDTSQPNSVMMDATHRNPVVMDAAHPSTAVMDAAHPSTAVMDAGQSSSVMMDSQAPTPYPMSSRERPFLCQVCNKRFTQKAHLIIHKRTHTGEKPYACHICHKRFAQSSHLTVHKRVHTGEKPFFCNFCGMGFCRKPRLEAHILQHMVKEGRQLPSGMKGDMMSRLSMVGLDGLGSSLDLTANQESLDAATQLMELRMKGNFNTKVKPEPLDHKVSSELGVAGGKRKEIDHEGDRNEESIGSERKRRKPEFVRRVGSGEGDAAGGTYEDGGNVEDSDETEEDDGDCDNTIAEMMRRKKEGSHNSFLGLLPDDIEKFTSSLTELSESQKQALSQSLLLNSSRGVLGNLVNNSNNNSNLTSSHSSALMMMASGVTMNGMVRTNARISLIDYTAEDILQHLISRDDVKSCEFCCIVFRDPAMYYLHRSMHDKMDVRCCNLCGKLLVDKYDFTAHFLSQHK